MVILWPGRVAAAHPADSSVKKNLVENLGSILVMNGFFFFFLEPINVCLGVKNPT